MSQTAECILAINTVTGACNIALIEREIVRIDRREDMLRGQDARLPGLIEDVLAEADKRFQDLNRIAVVTGPGSFTGIRIGVAFARGLGLALKIPVIGLTSLEAGLSPDLRVPVTAALPAQKRPPDRTWWTQQLDQGLGIGPVLEERESRLDLSELQQATPSAAWAALKAAKLKPETHPPDPVYARTPDAKPMRQQG